VDSNSAFHSKFVQFHEKFCSISSIILCVVRLHVFFCFIITKKLKDLMIQLFIQSYALWTQFFFDCVHICSICWLFLGFGAVYGGWNSYWGWDG
jgi:hypothetical protein